ncbi:hypothetical protein IWZ00DRAFT_367193 [Phyllosticta capitalensis]|uniref:Uncharacterized protein n=1 Tax=Phyllosticta capitalensis TaxID=121624 RepID=A0ABR1YDP5_9PEZI
MSSSSSSASSSSTPTPALNELMDAARTGSNYRVATLDGSLFLLVPRTHSATDEGGVIATSSNAQVPFILEHSTTVNGDLANIRHEDAVRHQGTATPASIAARSLSGPTTEGSMSGFNTREKGATSSNMTVVCAARISDLDMSLTVLQAADGGVNTTYDRGDPSVGALALLPTADERGNLNASVCPLAAQTVVSMATGQPLLLHFVSDASVNITSTGFTATVGATGSTASTVGGAPAPVMVSQYLLQS